MRITAKKACVAVLLASVFLLAQFHFCADLSAGGDSTHLCPFCSTTTAAIAANIPILGIAPAVTRLEITEPEIATAVNTAASISPRAPPVA